MPEFLAAHGCPQETWTYIGDAVYAGFDGTAAVLATDREDGTHWMALELDALQTLQEWAGRMAQS